MDQDVIVCERPYFTRTAKVSYQHELSAQKNKGSFYDSSVSFNCCSL